jgi:hypothetical protein
MKTAARARWEEANRDSMRAYQRAYYLAHKAQRAAQGKRWHEANREQQIAKSRAAYARDRAKRLAEQKEARAADPEKYRLGRRRRTYGISEAVQLLLYAAQGYACAICRDDGGERGLFIDHDHLTGKVRGLLCEGCNTAIGRMKDDPVRMRAAALYLARGGVV